MHGFGNEFLITKGPLEISAEEVSNLCDRNMGVGSDGFLVVTPLNGKKVKMEYWNADGAKAEMCGNGLRCVARFSVDNNLIKEKQFIVETLAGPLEVLIDGDDYTKIDIQVGVVKANEDSMVIQGLDFHITSVGNPHAVTFVNNVQDFDVSAIGSIVENTKQFSNKTNVEFVQIVDDKKIKLRTWK